MKESDSGDEGCNVPGNTRCPFVILIDEWTVGYTGV